MKEFFLEGLEKLEIMLEEETIDKLMIYANMLYEYNSHTNLTAIRDKEDMIEKHFLDTIIIHKELAIREGRGIDIGTGAGFPGLVIAICNPNLHMTLMDSVGKKTKFLELVKEKLALGNVTIVNNRAEEYVPFHREEFDIGFCRGVNRLNVILEYVLPFIKVGGIFMPQKLEYVDELREAENALNILGGEFVEVYEKKLPFTEDSRVILKIKKVFSTPEKYPRRTGVPLKRPL